MLKLVRWKLFRLRKNCITLQQMNSQNLHNIIHCMQDDQSITLPEEEGKLSKNIWETCYGRKFGNACGGEKNFKCKKTFSPYIDENMNAIRLKNML